MLLNLLKVCYSDEIIIWLSSIRIMYRIALFLSGEIGIAGTLFKQPRCKFFKEWSQFIPLRAKRVGEFIEIRQQKFHPPIY